MGEGQLQLEQQQQQSSRNRMNFVESFVEGIAKDMALDKATDRVNEYAEKHVKTKDPYREDVGGGKTRKLKLRDSATKEEQKMWKWVQRRAWVDDKCFMGCYPVDCGVGLGPLVVALPCIGPLLMYAVHARLTTRAGMFFNLDAKTVAKLNANILFDLFLTFPPVIGSFFSWMNGCSSRNAAIIHSEVTKMLLRREQAQRQAGQPGLGLGLHEVDTQTTYAASNPFDHRTATTAAAGTRPNNHTPAVPPKDYKAPQRPHQAHHPASPPGNTADPYRSFV